MNTYLRIDAQDDPTLSYYSITHKRGATNEYLQRAYSEIRWRYGFSENDDRVLVQFKSLLKNKNFAGLFGTISEKLAMMLDDNIDSIEKLDLSTLPVHVELDIYNQYEIPLSNILEQCTRNSKENIPENFFPLAVRQILPNGNYFVERPPFQLEVPITKSSSVKVWMPWTMTTINKENRTDAYLFFGSKKLETVDDKYLPCVFPNIYGSGKICFSNSLYDAGFDLHSAFDLRYTYSFLFNEYINGGWNQDLGSNLGQLFWSAHQFVNDLIKNKSHQQFPMIAKFFNVTKEDMKVSYPRLTDKAYNKMYDKIRGTWAMSVKDMYQYTFLALSCFSLEETLKFYEEVSLHSSNIARTFGDITKDLSINVSQTLITNFVKQIRSQSDISLNNINGTINIIFLNPQTSKFWNSWNADYSRDSSTAILSSCSTQVTHIINDFIAKAKNNIFTNGYYVIDESIADQKQEIIYHEVDNGNYYADALKRYFNNTSDHIGDTDEYRDSGIQ